VWENDDEGTALLKIGLKERNAEMTQYWSMKTFAGWWTLFREENIVGIDQEGVDADYQSMSDEDVQQLLTTNQGYTEYIDRVFREFSKWMQGGDLIIIGTGQVAAFNLAGVARVRGNYFFDAGRTPRHLREVEFLAIPQVPRPMQRFSRTSRLELIHETDFYEAILSIVGG
jgi:hypothetical protein